MAEIKGNGFLKLAAMDTLERLGQCRSCSGEERGELTGGNDQNGNTQHSVESGTNSDISEMTDSEPEQLVDDELESSSGSSSGDSSPEPNSLRQDFKASESDSEVIELEPIETDHQSETSENEFDPLGICPENVCPDCFKRAANLKYHQFSFGIHDHLTSLCGASDQKHWHLRSSIISAVEQCVIEKKIPDHGWR